MSDCYVIAEIGVNHNGDVGLATKMIDAAKECGADAVKFQTFSASTLATADTPKVGYQESTTSRTESHFDMLKRLELSDQAHRTLFGYCKDIGIEFMSTPYDVRAATFLHELGVNTFKTASADIVDLRLHEYLAGTGKRCLVSTGMATLDEIEDVLAVYREARSRNVVLLHCVSNYPCSLNNLNLNVLLTLRQKFGLEVGYSDHSPGQTAACLAVALGATVIEKHFTLDKSLDGPDHKASASPEEFSAMVQAVRQALIALGSGDKRCQDEEAQMRMVSRKSVVLSGGMQKGQVLRKEHLDLKRPGTGLYASAIPGLVGRAIKRDLPKDHIVSWSDVE